MRQFKGANLAQVDRIQPRFSVRTLVFASLMILFGVIYARIQVQQAEKQVEQFTPAPEATVAKPMIVPGLFDGVEDATPEQRVRLEREELEVLKASARQLVPAHFELPEARFLTPAVAAELNEQADQQRAALISARGRLSHLIERPALINSSEREWFGSAQTEEGLPFHFLTIENSLAEALAPGDWVRVDGFFMKRLSSEDPQSGQFVDGPLLVGRALERSFEGLGPVPSLEPALFHGLSDDTLDERPGLPELMRWLVLSWMRDLPEGAIDWANAPVLDKAAMEAIVTNGDSSRGQAYRVAVAQLQALNSRRVGENPARLAYVTEGWIGNSTWTAGQPVLTFIAPEKLPALAIGTKVTADVVFLKNIAYETVDGTRRLVPLFALHRLEPFIVPEPLGMKRLTVAFIALLAGMIALLVVLVRRDQKRTEALQKQLVEARRQRGRRSASAPA